MQWQRKLPPPLLQEESPQSRLCASAEQPFPISVFSLYRRQEHRATGTRKFFLAISPCIWYSVSVSICRCVGIGRRGGLKIHWANPPCGFDPRHRHQFAANLHSSRRLFHAVIPHFQNFRHFIRLRIPGKSAKKVVDLLPVFGYNGWVWLKL